MSQQNNYILNFSDLPNGKHNFEYKLNDDFFAQFDDIDIKKGNIDVKIAAEKQNLNIELAFEIKGTINVICDRCLDDITLPIEQQEKLLVKIGENRFDENADTLTISDNESEFNISWLLYEIVATAAPLQRLHKDGECNAEMMKIYNRYAATEKNDDFTEKKTNKNDPRWDALKNINDNI